MTDEASVTVLIPARNEEPDIEACLRAVLAQDHPHDRMEIVLVDGGSADGTQAVASRVLSESDIDWKIVDNPTGTTPSNLNAGLAVASGTVLCRVDARSLIPSEYVRLCAGVLADRPDVAVVGGAQIAVPRSSTVRAMGIARALNNRYAMGGARYRAGAESGSTDTVYLGAFRTAQLRDAGGWDEVLTTNQDYELNRRMADRGVVWFDQRLEVGYVPRATIGQLWTQYHRFGRWKVRYWRHSGDRPQRRQIVLFVGAPLAGLGAGVVLLLLKSPARRAFALASGVLGLGVLESRGSAGPDAGARSRAVSIVAMLTVAGGWVSGVWRETLARPR